MTFGDSDSGRKDPLQQMCDLLVPVLGFRPATADIRILGGRGGTSFGYHLKDEGAMIFWDGGEKGLYLMGMAGYYPVTDASDLPAALATMRRADRITTRVLAVALPLLTIVCIVMFIVGS